MTQSRNAAIGKLGSLMSDEKYYYVGVEEHFGCGNASRVYGLNSDILLALNNRFPRLDHYMTSNDIIRGPPFSVINALAESGYRVICSMGDKGQRMWTLQREL